MWWKSVRSLLAIMVGMTFCYCTVVKIIPAEAFVGVAATVFALYFERSDRTKPTP